MAYGDIGGTVTELILTCKTPQTGSVQINKGDALALVGPYTISNTATAEAPVFGQAMAATSENNVSIPVKVRGICLFEFTGNAPNIDGATGVVFSDTPGKVKKPQTGTGRGIVIKVDSSRNLLHLLL